ncbi:MAG TPA: hypothetical protein VF556_12145 [Pyrinomonadaceae bacterium]|jgi:hypothetical protein
MNLKNLYFIIIAVFVSSSLFAVTAEAQRKTSRKSNTTKAKTLTVEQKAFLEDILATTDDVDLKYTTDLKKFAYAVSFLKKKTELEGFDIPEPLKTYAFDMMDAYDSWVILYGRVTHQGLIDSLIRLDEREGKKDEITPAIISRYNLAGLNPLIAVDVLRKNAFSSKIRFRNTLIKYPVEKETVERIQKKELNAVKEKISIQLKNLSKFIFVFGSVTKSIEDIDRDIKTGRVSQFVINLNEQNKQKTIESFSNFQIGISDLEKELLRNPSYRNSQGQIQEISDLTTFALNAAKSGEYKKSGDTLLLLFNKLTDLLAIKTESEQVK